MKNWRSWPIGQIKLNDSHYPEELKKLKKPPEILYFRGEWNDQIFKKTLAVVGSRRMTGYGQEVVERLLPPLINHGVTILSGFMFGVDAAAHQTTCDMGGKTVAILGGGLDVLTPEEHDKLYSQILNTGGLVLSEYIPNFQPTLWSFPQRNRIVAGLATIGVLIVEAGMKSGSLITAKLAIEQNKHLFAIPGQITSSVSAGTNWLIATRQADAVTEVVDIFYTGESQKQLNIFDGATNDELILLKLTENEALTIDELAKKSNKSIAEITQLTSMMVLKNLLMEANGTFRAQRQK